MEAEGWVVVRMRQWVTLEASGYQRLEDVARGKETH